jgi:hypothetical protein
MGRAVLRSAAAGLVLAGMFGVPPHADAVKHGRFRQGRPASERAETVARATWGTLPCNGRVRLRFAPLPAELNAVSEWTQVVGSGELLTCTVTFNARMRWRYVRFCSILVHEYGHLTGHAHTSDRADVMYPRYVRAFRPCAAGAARRAGASSASRR